MDGLQLTKLFHIDDSLLSHADRSTSIYCVKKLDGTHGRKDPLAVTRGKTHEHLGMKIYFSLKRKVGISQHNFENRMRLEFLEGLRGKHRNTVAPKDLFETCLDALLIESKSKDFCHKTTSKCLWLS